MQKLVKIILIPTTIVLLSFMIFKSYTYLYQNGYFLSKEEKYFYQELKKFVDSGKESIELKELTNFEWDEVAFIEPYSFPNDSKSIYSEDFKLNKKISNSQDHEACLLFLNTKTKYGYVIEVSPYSYKSSSNEFLHLSEARLILKNNKFFLTTSNQ